jgi:hypothetical protein
MLLDLSHNALSGALPRQWGALSALSYLYLNANNLTLDELPCEWGSGMISLKLADLSGNRVLPRGVAAASAVAPRSVASTHAATVGQWGRASEEASVGCSQAGKLGSRSRSSSRVLFWTGQSAGVVEDVFNSSSSGSTNDKAFRSAVGRSGFSGRLDAPRCWLRRFCYQEGAFVCLQRDKKHPAGGCTSYVYGASDLHIDASNQVCCGAKLASPVMQLPDAAMRYAVCMQSWWCSNIYAVVNLSQACRRWEVPACML